MIMYIEIPSNLVQKKLFSRNNTDFPWWITDFLQVKLLIFILIINICETHSSVNSYLFKVLLCIHFHLPINEVIGTFKRGNTLNISADTIAILLKCRLHLVWKDLLSKNTHKWFSLMLIFHTGSYYNLGDTRQCNDIIYSYTC